MLVRACGSNIREVGKSGDRVVIECIVSWGNVLYQKKNKTQKQIIWDKPIQENIM